MNESPTYRELLAANRQLVAENELLHKENAKLNGLVKDLLEVDKETKNIEVISANKAPKLVFQEKKLFVFGRKRRLTISNVLLHLRILSFMLNRG